MVRDQTIFMSEQFKDLDQIMEQKKSLVAKYKQLNQANKETMKEN